MKVTIDPRTKSGDVTVTGDVLTVEDWNLSGIAEALADELRAAVESQPGSKWNRTGDLVRGIRASDDAVTVPHDHLTRDPALAEKFARDVMPANPLADKRVQEEIEKAAAAAVRTSK